MAERTRFVDHEVADALGRGLDQVVLLGAGYDGRALRFGGGPARWFEVDRPATQADKRRRLEALGRAPRRTCAFVGLDLAPRRRGRGPRPRPATTTRGPRSSWPRVLFDSLTLESRGRAL